MIDRASTKALLVKFHYSVDFKSDRFAANHLPERERDLLAKSGFANGKRQRSERDSMLRMGVGEKGREMRMEVEMGKALKCDDEIGKRGKLSTGERGTIIEERERFKRQVWK